MTVTPTFGVRPVAALSLQFWSDVHSFVFAVHNVKLSIKNRSGFTTTYAGDWFDSGRLADDYNWPGTISNDDHQEILCYERDWSAAGCSGYVQYIFHHLEV